MDGLYQIPWVLDPGVPLSYARLDTFKDTRFRSEAE